MNIFSRQTPLIRKKTAFFTQGTYHGYRRDELLGQHGINMNIVLLPHKQTGAFPAGNCCLFSNNSSALHIFGIAHFATVKVSHPVPHVHGVHRGFAVEGGLGQAFVVEQGNRGAGFVQGLRRS
jgi:hypothetical protein